MSTGWWAVPKPNKFGDYLIFKVSNDIPTDIDYDIFKYLSKKNIQVYFALLDKKSNIKFSNINQQISDPKRDRQNLSYMDLSSFLDSLKINKPSRDPLLALENVRDLTKQQRAINYIKTNNMLYEVGLQRYFANYILTVYFGKYILNLDGFLFKNDELVLYETKFKYPASNNKFGLNKGFINWFKWILSREIKIYHCILNNGTHDENVTVLDALEDPTIKKQCTWLFCEINHDHLKPSISYAPSKTHIEGKSLQKVTYMDFSEFKKIKPLFS